MQRSFLPTGPLADWMTTLGWDGNEVHVPQLSVWIALWDREQAQHRAGALRPWGRGPSASRPAPLGQHRIGRQLFKRLHPLRGVFDPQGQWHDVTEAAAVESALWHNREGVWNTAPTYPLVAKHILEAYI